MWTVNSTSGPPDLKLQLFHHNGRFSIRSFHSNNYESTKKRRRRKKCFFVELVCVLLAIITGKVSRGENNNYFVKCSILITAIKY